ncbi:tumor necrosis factor receptor superfamily member 14-like, partial [Cheilinus undulatus]|uniref:tumor necrosis factor receptor superfamily member 14-like n=1 Tax=Cheilinus undulatus TaxID=241271 RepID=UPI001BD52433
MCPPGSGLTMKEPCTRTSDTVCKPVEGFYCVKLDKQSCIEARKHAVCERGQYIAQKGTSYTDTECSNCTAGTFSNGTMSSCQKHKQCGISLLLKPGTESEDAQCGHLHPAIVAVIV